MSEKCHAPKDLVSVSSQTLPQVYFFKPPVLIEASIKRWDKSIGIDLLLLSAIIKYTLDKPGHPTHFKRICVETHNILFLLITVWTSSDWTPAHDTVNTFLLPAVPI